MPTRVVGLCRASPARALTASGAHTSRRSTGPRERAGLIDFSGMAVAVTGVVITCIFGPLGDGIPDMDKLAAAMRRPPFILLTTFGWAGCLAWLLLWRVKALERFRPARDAPICAFVSGATSALCGAYSLMFFKIIMSNIREFASGDAECQGSILQRPMLWSSVVFLPLAAIGQMYFLESTMGSGGTNYVIPCYTGLIVVGSAVVGGIVFEEFDNIQGTNLALFLVGVLLVLVGLVILSKSQAKRARESRRVRRESAASTEPSAERRPSVDMATSPTPPQRKRSPSRTPSPPDGSTDTGSGTSAPSSPEPLGDPPAAAPGAVSLAIDYDNDPLVA